MVLLYLITKRKQSLIIIYSDFLLQSNIHANITSKCIYNIVLQAMNKEKKESITSQLGQILKTSDWKLNRLWVLFFLLLLLFFTALI